MLAPSLCIDLPFDPEETVALKLLCRFNESEAACPAFCIAPFKAVLTVASNDSYIEKPGCLFKSPLCVQKSKIDERIEQM